VLGRALLAQGDRTRALPYLSKACHTAPVITPKTKDVCELLARNYTHDEASVGE
jgi:hypothetical protein